MPAVQFSWNKRILEAGAAHRRSSRNAILLIVLMLAGACGTQPFATKPPRPSRPPSSSPAAMSATWIIDNVREIAGRPVTVVGAPKVIPADCGPAVLFDGKRDGLFLDGSPVEGLETFTIEALVRPDSGGAVEQRFVHFQENASEDRILLETRTAGQKWFLDTFICSGSTYQALNSPKLLHPLGQWHWVALVFDGRQMIQYVNGITELSTPITYAPQKAGRTSLGVRINQVSWFRGALREVRITPRALTERELQRYSPLRKRGPGAKSNFRISPATVARPPTMVCP